MQLCAHIFAVALVALALQACGSEDSGGEVGTPCDINEECADGLECDIHDGRGSCQKPHDD